MDILGDILTRIERENIDVAYRWKPLAMPIVWISELIL